MNVKTLRLIHRWASVSGKPFNEVKREYRKIRPGKDRADVQMLMQRGIRIAEGKEKP